MSPVINQFMRELEDLLNKKKSVLIKEGTLITLSEGKSLLSRDAVAYGLKEFLATLE